MKVLNEEQVRILEGFKQKVVRHPRLQEVMEELYARSLNPAGQALTAVIGPTGAGKTTLLHQVENALLEIHAERLQADQSFLPFVSVEVRSPPNWKQFFKDILENADEIQIKFKQAFREATPAGSQTDRPADPSPVAHRVAVEHMLRHRGLPPLLIDESQHLLKVAGGKKLIDQMDDLKSLSNMAGVKIVLFGNYELLSCGQLSDQLARRGCEIHFSRYRLDDSSDVQVFQNIIATFAKALPLHPSLDLLHQWKYLYRGSLGCVGTLEEWLHAGLAEALRSGRTELTPRDLQKTVRSDAALLKMAGELKKGELTWDLRKAKGRELDSLLGFDVPSPPPACASAPDKAAGRGRRPGERAPIRDPVGLSEVLK